MRLTLLTAITIACAVAATNACNVSSRFDNTPSDTTRATAGTGSMTAIVAGVPMSLVGRPGVIASRSGDNVTIAGTMSNGAQVILTVSGISKGGTYSLASGGLGAGTYQLDDATWMSNSTGGTGTITLTTLSQVQAIGSFTFTAAPLAGTTATGTKAITDGTFNVLF